MASEKLTPEQRADVEAQLAKDGLRLARDWYEPSPEQGWYVSVLVYEGYGRVVRKVWATDAR